MTSRAPGLDGHWRDVLLTVALFIIFAQLYYIMSGGSVPAHDMPTTPAVSRIRLTSSQCELSLTAAAIAGLTLPLGATWGRPCHVHIKCQQCFCFVHIKH